MSGQTVASLQAVVGADVSGFTSAMGQVRSSLKSVSTAAREMSTAGFQNALRTGGQFNSMLVDGARAARLSTTQLFGMAQASGLWTQKQLAAATAAEILTKRGVQLSEMVKSGNMTTEQAGKMYANYVKEQEKAIRSTMSFSEKYGEFSKKLNDGALSLAKIGATSYAVGMAGKQIYTLARSGAELDYTRQKFDRLSASMGVTGDIMLNELKVATRGTVSEMDLAKQGADLFQLGLAGSAEEAVRLSRVMTALGMDTNEMTLALANQSKRRLDQLGLSLTKFNEIEAKLRASGMSKQDAFKEAFLQTAEQTVLLTGNRADTQFGSFLRAEASTKDLFNQWKMSLPGAKMGPLFGGDTVAGTADKVAMFMSGMRDLISGRNVWDFSGGLGAEKWVRKAGVQDVSDLWRAQSQNRGRGPGGTGFGATVGLSALQSYTAMAYAQQGKGGLPSAGGAPGPDYATMFGGGMDIAKIAAQYKNALDEVKGALADGKIKSDEYSLATAELGSQYKATMQEMALATLEQKDATDELKYNFAVASGQITQAAANQAVAQDKLAEAYMNGKLTADQYASGLTSVMDMVQGMDGERANAYIDVWIRIHGSIPGNFSKGGNKDPNYQDAVASGMSSREAREEAKSAAEGGQLSGNWTLVGDGPGGQITPYSELISPSGYVYDAKTTKAMLESGLVKQPRAMLFGGELAGDVVTSGYTANILERKGRRAKGGGSAPIVPSGGDVSIEAAAEYIAAPIVSAVSDQLATQQMAIIRATNESVVENKTTNRLLMALLAKMPSGMEIGRAVTGDRNKFS